MIFRIICIVIILCKSSSEANAYYENSKQTKWIEAQNSCALATPAFRSELGVNVVNITLSVTTDLWVGYFKALTGFEYKGCIRNENFKPRIELTRLTIGRCYSECGRKQLVGISGGNCYCEDQINFDEGDQYKSTYCYTSRKCSAVVCNACDENDCVSIYKVNKDDTKTRNMNIDEGMCLKMNADSNQVTQPNKHYTWIHSGQHNLVLCAFRRGGLHYSRGIDNWRESANWCFANKGSPFTYAELKTKLDSFQNPIWTSITCSDVIYTFKANCDEGIMWNTMQNSVCVVCASDNALGYYDKEYDNNLTNIRFGYLASKHDRTVLKFKDAGSTQKMALCTSVSTKSLETSTRVFQTPEKHDSIDKELNEQSTTSSDTETETATTSIEMSSDQGLDELNTEQSVENQDPYASATLGASVGFVLFVIAVVVVVVVLKKRNKLQTPCKGTARDAKSHDTSSGDTSHTMTREKTIRMTIKNDVNESNDTNDAHTYFVLEKHVKEESCISDTTYNTTFSAETNTEMENRNIYNKLDIDTDTTYDHAQKKRNIDHSKAEDTYDTPKMEALANKVDNNPNKFGDANEDAYNHINGKPFKTSRTDNVYGVPQYLGNSNGEASTRQKINPLCGGDTYSHINNTVKSRKPDTEYSVPSHSNASSGESNDQESHYDVTDTDIKVLDTDNEYSKIGTIC